jgi:glycosyltransferase involved in cell wall biosynthesis
MGDSQKRKIAILAYKIESYDSDSFKEEILSYSKDCIIILFSVSSGKVWIDYMPADCYIKSPVLFLHKLSKNTRINYYLYPISFVSDHFRIAKYIFNILLKYKVSIIFVENTYVAGIVSFFKQFKLFQKMLYAPGDWLANSKSRKGIWSYLGGMVIFPIFDYFACKYSDITINSTELQKELRYKFWGRAIPKVEIFLSPLLRLKKISKEPVNKKKILFLGNIRSDSGLELIIEALANLREDLDVTLKLVGPYNELHEYIVQMARSCHVENRVEFIGTVGRSNFGEVFADCFCGVNLITTKDSYTAYTLPAKVFDYLQYGLPVITTENAGIISDVVLHKKLGFVIQPCVSDFMKAVKEIHEKHDIYQENISKYFDSTANNNDLFKKLLGSALP